MTRTNDSYTVKELRETAKIYNIKNISKLNKSELNDAIIKCMEITSYELACSLEDKPELKEEVIQYYQTPEGTTNKSRECDLENCDDIMNMACSLTCEIDQNPLWQGRTCELDVIAISNNSRPINGYTVARETYVNSDIWQRTDFTYQEKREIYDNYCASLYDMYEYKYDMKLDVEFCTSLDSKDTWLCCELPVINYGYFSRTFNRSAYQDCITNRLSHLHSVA